MKSVKNPIQFASFSEVSIQRKFTILFLVASIVPMGLLYYVYLQNTNTGTVGISTAAFTVAMGFMATGVLVGYLSIRSLLVKITDISNFNRTALEPFLSPEIVQELQKGENEIEVLGRSFSAVISQLEKDIKELEVKNEQLKSLDKLKDEFVSIVSHEFRLPLAIIQESVHQIAEGMYGLPNDQQLKYLNMSLRNIERLGGLIDNLLDLSKIEEGKLKLIRSNIDVVDIVKEVILDITPKVQKKGLELRTNFSHDKSEVYADRDKIIQVFVNLISNAYKFTQTGSIEVSVVERDAFVECSVIDSGVGIAPEDIPNIFSKFFQVRPQGGPGEKGTGLGLVICKHIVELHNGQIFVDSKRSKGTTFTFTLPRRSR